VLAVRGPHHSLPHQQVSSETLRLDLHFGPASPLVLWKRTVHHAYCPDVQLARSSDSEAGWEGVKIP
jgi:hypothetical protein